MPYSDAKEEEVPDTSNELGRNLPPSSTPETEAEETEPDSTDSSSDDVMFDPADGDSDGTDEPDASAEPELPTGPPFPDAQGWAAVTPGGRGGEIIRVTSLELSGEGSIASALGRPGPKIIVFEVGGVIDLREFVLPIQSPYVTIAGQTAPSPGITLIRGGIRITSHDVVIQHIRVRPGDLGRDEGSGWEVDGISTDSGASKVVVDHCSVTWSTDENLSASGDRFGGNTPDEWREHTSHQITFSNNIIAEGLSESTHSQGEHSKGGLIHDNVTDVLIFGNLYFSNTDRHPLFKGGARGVVANNYIANPGSRAMRYTLHEAEWGEHEYQLGLMSIVGNVFQYGPNTPEGTPLLHVSGIGPVDAWLDDNVIIAAADAGSPAMIDDENELLNQVSAPPIWHESVNPMPGDELASYIRDNVGARPWDRDEIDARIVEQALSGEGEIIDSQEEVGGYPEMEATEAPFIENEWDLDTMTRIESE